jgi:hypothetical protein
MRLSVMPNIQHAEGVAVAAVPGAPMSRDLTER